MEASKKGVAFALLQEPYVGGRSRMGNYRGTRVFQNANQGEGSIKAAILVFDDELDVIQCPDFTTNNIVVVKIKTRAWEIVVVSFYFEPKPAKIKPYLQQLTDIKKHFSRYLILGGDSNAKYPWWGSPVLNSRGEDMAGTIEELDMQVLNEGTIPTYDTVRGGIRYTSFVDVTACTLDMLNLVEDWEIDEGATTSDHNTILFKIRLTRSKGKILQDPQGYTTAGKQIGASLTGKWPSC